MQFLVVEVACSGYNDILANIIVSMVVVNHLPGNGLHIVQVSQNGESHLMIFEDTTMCNLNGSFEWLAFLSFKEFTMNGTALIFDILIAIK